MHRIAYPQCALLMAPIQALQHARSPACHAAIAPLRPTGSRGPGCGVRACEFTVFGERVSRPAVPVRVPHGGGGPAAVFLHTFCRHRPASRAEAAVVTAVTIVGVVLRAGVTGATTVLPGTAHHRDAAATTPMARRLLPRRARDPRSPSRRMRKRLRTSDAWRLRWRRWRRTMRMTK